MNGNERLWNGRSPAEKTGVVAIALRRLNAVVVAVAIAVVLRIVLSPFGRWRRAREPVRRRRRRRRSA